MVTTMCRGRAKYSGKFSDLWRRAAVVALSYVFILQSLLIGVVGSQIAANSEEAPTGYVLCLGSGQNGQHAPADTPDRHTVGHCIFCFAAAHGFALAPSQVVGAPWIAGSSEGNAPPAGWEISLQAEFNVARPRAPPIST